MVVKESFENGAAKLQVSIQDGYKWDFSRFPQDPQIMSMLVYVYWIHFFPEICPSGHITISNWDQEYPQCCWSTDPAKREIFLSTDNSFLSQEIYQLAHELTHYFIGGSEEGHNNWFYETIAEVASNYFLLKMAKIFEDDKKFPASYADGLRGYAEKLTGYAEKRTGCAKAELIPDPRLWLLKNGNELLTNKENRKLNAEAGKVLLPYFLAHTDIWNILLFAPLKNEELSMLFTDWENAIPEKYPQLREHIKYFRSVFC